MDDTMSWFVEINYYSPAVRTALVGVKGELLAVRHI